MLGTSHPWLGLSTGLAEEPDGALYISDDMQGRIWRVTWRGER